MAGAASSSSSTGSIAGVTNGVISGGPTGKRKKIKDIIRRKK